MSMYVIFFTFLFISVLSVLTLKALRKRLDSLEIFIHFMFTSYLGQTFFYLLSSPYERLRVVEEPLPFWTARLTFAVIFPVTLLWVLYFLRGNHRFSPRLAICFLWVVSGVLTEKLLLTIGVLESKSVSWYPSIDLVLAMIVLYFSTNFFEKLPYILRIEKMIKSE